MKAIKYMAFLLVVLLKFVYFWSTIKDNEQELIKT
jgi:hypothetical protein